MKLLALLIGLAVERLATHLFHLRELRWLDRVIDAGFRHVERLAGWPPIIPIALLAILLVLPVAIVRISIGDTLYGFPYLLLALIVLFFSFGPKDIGEDIVQYTKAIADDDAEEVQHAARTLIEADVPESVPERTRRVEEAVCVQANNRLFAVIFWFVVLGPAAAWAYRVVDLIRRRAVFRVSRAEAQGDLEACARSKGGASQLHALLAWIPARLTAIGFGLAGSFESATSAWRAPPQAEVLSLGEQNEQLLARVGTAALAVGTRADESDTERAIRGAHAARGLVIRSLFLWAAAIALMTLYGWFV